MTVLTQTTDSTDSIEPAVSRKPQSLREGLPALIALALAMLVEMVDNSILNVALPNIGTHLGATTTQMQWFVGGYSLAFGSLLMLGGALGDKFGRRKIMLIGLVLFGLTGLSTLAITAAWQLVAARIVAGAFAAMIAPITGSLVYSLFDDDTLRRKGIGIIITVAVIGSTLGPVLSGLALEFVSWHWLLAVNGPIALLAFLGIFFGIKTDEADTLSTARVDAVGAVLSIMGLGGGLYLFTAGSEFGWFAWPTIASAVVAVVGIVGFIRYESHAKEPMLDPRLLRQPTVAGSILLQLSGALSMVAVCYIASQLFQFAWGWTPLRAGFGTMPLVLGMMLANPFIEKFVSRFGQRRVAVGGIVLAIVGMLITIWGIGIGYAPLVPAFLLIAVGLNAIMTTCSVALLGALPSEKISLGQAMSDTAQELGNSFGVAAVGTTVATLFAVDMPQMPWTAAQIDSFEHAMVVSLMVIVGVVTAVAILGARTLTDSTEV